MSYKLTNISGGLIVCDLAVKGKTLRLKNKHSETIKDTEITPYIKRLSTSGLILMEEVKVSTKTTKKSTVKSSENKKED